MQIAESRMNLNKQDHQYVNKKIQAKSGGGIRLL